MRERVLAIYPHPDDETIGKAGTFIDHVKKGDEVTLICATMGQMGRKMGNPFFANRETLTDIRKKELLDACAAIGIQDVRMWMMQDKTLQFRKKAFLADKVQAVIDEVKPTLVYSYYPEYGVHPDHDALSEATILAIKRLPTQERPMFLGSVISREGKDALGAPDIINDVSHVINAKIKALQAHRSQTEHWLDIVNNPSMSAKERDEFLKKQRQEQFWVYRDKRR